MSVGLVLFIVSILPTLLLTGGLAAVMPPAAAPVAAVLIGIPWLLGMMIGTHLITEKLSKRWSR